MALGTAESLETLAGGFLSTDGPVWCPEGYLLFSDTAAKTAYKLTPDGRTTHYNRGLNNGRWAGTQFSSTGVTRDLQGRLVICEPANSCVTRIEKDGSPTVLADYFEGRRLNSPSDIVCRSDGSLYFTDPPWEEAGDEARDLPFNGVFRIVEGRRLQLLAADLSRPGGLAFSPDQRVLYVANSDPCRRLWMRYRVDPDGVLTTGDVFHDASSAPVDGVPDGLKVDRAGTVLATGPGGIWVLSPCGDHIGTIRIPELPTNLEWGGDGTDLYITAGTSIYRMRWPVSGSFL